MGDESGKSFKWTDFETPETVPLTLKCRAKWIEIFIIRIDKSIRFLILLIEFFALDLQWIVSILR